MRQQTFILDFAVAIGVYGLGEGLEQVAGILECWEGCVSNGVRMLWRFSANGKGGVGGS